VEGGRGREAKPTWLTQVQKSYHSRLVSTRAEGHKKTSEAIWLPSTIYRPLGVHKLLLRQ